MFYQEYDLADPESLADRKVIVCQDAVHTFIEPLPGILRFVGIEQITFDAGRVST